MPYLFRRISSNSSGRAGSTPSPDGAARPLRRHRRRRRLAAAFAALFVLALAVPAGSFAVAVTRSNGDPFSVNATEWARDHDLGWLVDRVEGAWYARHQPPVGGTPAGGIPTVTATVGAPVRPVVRRARTHHAPVVDPPCPAAVRPVAVAPLAGEGAWQVAGRAPGLVCVTFLRPDAVHTGVLVGVAWMNMRRLRATLHNGTALPGGGPWLAGPQIAPVDLPRVVAALNSGFRLDASRGGYFTEGRTVKPLVDGRASLVIRRDGSIDVGLWGRDDRAGPSIASVRQNLDLVVDGGRVVPGLTGNSHAWGATLGNQIFTWRSGAGVDAAGNLVYVGGPGLDVQTLATMLQRAGCIRAMELDINPSWVTLTTFTGTSPTTIRATKLLADMQRPADRYLHPGTRDFVELDLRH